MWRQKGDAGKARSLARRAAKLEERLRSGERTTRPRRTKKAGDR
jgi:hypothetical protein